MKKIIFLISLLILLFLSSCTEYRTTSNSTEVKEEELLLPIEFKQYQDELDYYFDIISKGDNFLNEGNYKGALENFLIAKDSFIHISELDKISKSLNVEYNLERDWKKLILQSQVGTQSKISEAYIGLGDDINATKSLKELVKMMSQIEIINDNFDMINNLGEEPCVFGGKIHQIPTSSYCATHDKYNAWLCNNGYREYGSLCVKATRSGQCDIKGNVSFTTREKIYHLRGCEYYNTTTIDTRYGERYFCSEHEANVNGWRKAYGCR